jgi:hypothetical protein
MKSSTQWLEYRKLELIDSQEPGSRSNKLPLISVLDRIWQSLLTLLSSKPELRVWQTCDRAGHTWWNAYDPVKEQSARLGSEAEMRIWIEQHYYH